MKKSYYIKAGLIFLLLLILDQGTKYAALLFLKGKDGISLIPHVLELTYLENRGAAFGILQNRQGLFILLTAAAVVFIAAVFYRISKKENQTGISACLLALLAGAAGNLIDRILHGYVIDFIYFSLIDFPVFNLADCYVTLSVAVLCVLFLFVYKDEE